MFDLNRYQQLLAAVDAADTNHEKGSSFESLCEYLFNCLNGVTVRERDINMGSEEIDLVLWNAQIEDCFKPFDFIVLVECKNWSSPVGAPALDSFIAKMRRRTLNIGIFIAANGVTGDFLNGNRGDGAVDIIKQALSEGIRVIVLNREDLDTINTLDALRNLILQRFCRLFVHKVLNE